MTGSRAHVRRLPVALGVGIVALVALVLAAACPAGSSEFPTGDAQASADTFSLTIKAANATIGFAYGRSLAQYQDRTGSAEARALDLGALPTLFGGEQCDGSAPLLNPATLPPVSSADSGNPGSDQSRRVSANLPGISGGPAGELVGYQDATATNLPQSHAVTDSVPADIFLVALDGGHTETTTRLQDQVREAHAVVTAHQLRVFGGLFTFDQPRWEATARSGAQTSNSGSFTFASATVLGIPRSATDVMNDLAGFKAGLEQLLAPLGVTMDLPQVQVRDDGVKVTPMGFHIANPPFGTQVLIPFLGQIDPLIQSLRQQALKDDCKNATTLTIVDVLLGVLGGSGAIDALAGGVDVATHATDYSVPAVAPTTAAAEVEPPVAVSPESLAFGDTGTDLSGDLGFSPLDTGTGVDAGLEPLAVDTAPSADVAAAGVGAKEVTTDALPAASLSRFEDGSAGRAGVLVGVLGVVGAVAMCAGDRLIGRRTRRRIP